MPRWEGATTTLPASRGPSSVTLSVTSGITPIARPPVSAALRQVFGRDEQHVDPRAVVGQGQAQRFVSPRAPVDEEVAHRVQRAPALDDLGESLDDKMTNLGVSD